MSKIQFFRNTAVALAVAGPLTAAMATNGYFSHGYGMKAKGMGGAAVAMTDNAFAGANNPAVAAYAGNRMELGVDLFMPDRTASRTGNSTAALNGTYESDDTLFYVPEFGYNRTVNDKVSVGLTVYGNGGMNTNYPASSTNLLNGAGRLGVDLMQLIVAPTVAYKLDANQSLGVSPLLVYQKFKADGLNGFGISNGTGYDSSSGIGVRVGYLGKFGDRWTIGASYAPKVNMSKFDKYKGLFAEQGDFDIPENYTIGFSFAATPAVTLALDYQKISYSGVAAIANPSANILSGASLGANNGPGFGWTDVNVLKLGVEWKNSPALTLRAGFNLGDNPVKSSDTTFNILAPGVVTRHYTLGGTYAVSGNSELTVAYMYAPENSVSGATLGAIAGGGTETLKMSQQSLGIQFGWKY